MKRERIRSLRRRGKQREPETRQVFSKRFRYSFEAIRLQADAMEAPPGSEHLVVTVDSSKLKYYFKLDGDAFVLDKCESGI